MNITSLGFEGFRNLCDGEITPCRGVNVIYGKNAQGKTNLVECIWLLSGNRSFRGARDSELVGFGRDAAKIKAEFFSEGRIQTSEISLIRGKKGAFLNGVKQRSSAALLGHLCAVVFSPEHLTLVKGGPDGRRSFIDGAICQIKPGFKDTLSSYKRTLIQRNSLLKDIPRHPGLEETLDAWDQRLAVLGANVIRVRMKYTERLCECASRYHMGISHNSERLNIDYAGTVPKEYCGDIGSVRDQLLKMLLDKRNDDIAAGSTSAGPHRDDLEITINGESVRRYGSQGQQRSCVLSMKIAEEELIRLSVSEEPLVLLDDVLSELDSRRQDFLLNEIGDRQVFITCCESASVERLKGGKLFEINGGKVNF